MFTYQYVITPGEPNSLVAHGGLSNPAKEVNLKDCCGGYAAPGLYDVTSDNKLDLFVGAADGSVHF